MIIYARRTQRNNRLRHGLQVDKTFETTLLTLQDYRS